MNNDWFYDILRFCNYIYTLEDAKNDNKMLKGLLEDILNDEDDEFMSSYEIANDYIKRKCKILIDLIECGDRNEDIHIYVSILRKEWGDIVLSYNLKGAKDV